MPFHFQYLPNKSLENLELKQTLHRINRAFLHTIRQIVRQLSNNLRHDQEGYSEKCKTNSIE